MDCCFQKEQNWFRYRAAAVIIEEGYVLLASNERAEYYYSVGGGVQLGETAELAVVREVLEETGVRYEIDRLACIHENFFMGSGSLEGLKCHEVSLYFLMKPRGTRKLNSNSICVDGREYMNWLPISDLKNYRAYPSFYAGWLEQIPDGITHVVTRDVL